MAISRYEKYLQTLPHDWEQVSIEQIGRTFAGGTPSRNEPSFWNGTIAWVTPGELTTQNDKYLTETREYITESGLASCAATLLPQETLLVTTRATIGSVAIAGIQVSTNQGFKNIILDEFHDSLFYYYFLSGIASDEMRRLASGSTFDEISRRDFVRIIVPQPSLPEQRHIANILDTIDAQLQHTEQLIAKLKLQKRGLLHDLLTRGLDEHGQLRDPIAHPEQFKDSPLGRIPKEWEVTQLGYLAEMITSGSRGWASYYDNEGSVFLRISNLTREHVHMKLRELVYVNPPSTFEGARTAVEPGDILISITADLGIIGVIPSNLGDAYVNQHVALVRPNKEIDSYYVANYLAGEIGQKQFYRLNDSGAKSGLNLPTVAKILVAIPPKQEQIAIASIIGSLEADIRVEESHRDKFKLYKKGLMHDLLMGKVRIKAGEEMVEAW